MSAAVIIPLITLVGITLSWRLRFLQVSQLWNAFRFITPRKQDGGNLSSLGAVSAVLGGNLGTGNIAGIAVALSTGGPGALFWMWVMAFLSSILKYVGCFLGVRYRTLNERGEIVGGPMYYIKTGLQRPRLASLFCLLTICGALTTGNMVQINSLTLPFENAGVSPVMISLLIAFLVGATLLGGIKSFSTIASAVVPFMALAYLVACAIILFLKSDQVLPALQLIFKSAFGYQPVAGGALGFTLLSVIRTGFDRGLFATDSGLGLAPILHAPVNSNHPKASNEIVQGTISLFSPIIVMIVCTITGLVLMVTNVWQIEGCESTNQCMEAFRQGFAFEESGHVVLITLFFFAFTTVLTWAYCAERAVEFLIGRAYVRYFRLFFVLLVPVGSLLSVALVWQLADIALNFMLLVNLYAVIKLSPTVIRETRAFLNEKKQ